MVGQDAVATAQAFGEGVGFTGVVLTKLDGDARGGAALSVREITGVPILFASAGEKLEDFDVFHPDRMAGRILGMGDVLSLIEQAEQVFDAQQAEDAAAKIGSGELTLEDFLEQMLAIRKMGPIGNLLGMLPGAGQMKEALAAVDDSQLDRLQAIIRGMTPQERADPKIINASRRLRIANGSGVTVSEVNQLVDRFFEARKMMSSMVGGMGIPGLGRKSATRKNAKGKGGKGKKGKKFGPTPAQGPRPARRGHACRVPRPVEHAAGSRRTAARAGRFRLVQAEVPGQQVVPQHVRGIGLPDEEPIELWIVDGRISREPVDGAETIFDGGWILPGLVDAHCHVGLGPQGGVELDEAIAQAETEREAGALLLRDCGSPIDTRSLDDRDDLPRIIRAGRHLARPKRYIPGLPIDIEDESQLPDAVALQAQRGDGWVKLVGDWIDRGIGDLAPLWSDDVLKAAIDAAHATARGSPRTSSARMRCPV